jgi:hypothetical protein
MGPGCNTSMTPVALAEQRSGSSVEGETEI